MADLTALSKEAAMEPVREVGMKIKDMPVSELRHVEIQDFKRALQKIRPSVSKESLKAYQEWNNEFGILS